MDWVLGAVAGLVAGLSAGLAGIGGGVIMVPVLALVFGFDQQLAQGTSSLAIIFAALAGSQVNLRNKRIDVRIAVLLGLGGAVTGYFGAYLAGRMDPSALRRYFGIFVLISGVRMGVRAIHSRRAETGG